MEIDVAALLAPLDGGSPCGDDIEYDPDFIELQTLARGKEEQQVGKSIIAAEEPDHADLARRALALLGRTKDLRVAVILAAAVLRTDGTVSFSKVLAFVRGALETYWDHVHPLLDAEDDNDPTARVNAVAALAAAGFTGEAEVLKGLRLAPLTDSRAFGRFSLRDVLVVQKEIPAPPGMEGKLKLSDIAAAFQDTPPDRLSMIRQSVAEARAHVRAIDAIFSEKVGAQGPDLGGLAKTLQRLAEAIEAFAAEAPAEEPAEAPAPDAAPAAPGAAPAAAAPARAAPAAAPGTISGPDDVLHAIDRIVEYYTKREPSSPVPLLLARARRLVNADFKTIVRDMARGGMDQVRTIGGLDDD